MKKLFEKVDKRIEELQELEKLFVETDEFKRQTKEIKDFVNEFKALFDAFVTDHIKLHTTIAEEPGRPQLSDLEGKNVSILTKEGDIYRITILAIDYEWMLIQFNNCNKQTIQWWPTNSIASIEVLSDKKVD